MHVLKGSSWNVSTFQLFTYGKVWFDHYHLSHKIYPYELWKILTRHSRKNTGVNNQKWQCTQQYCAWWVAVTSSPYWSFEHNKVMMMLLEEIKRFPSVICNCANTRHVEISTKVSGLVILVICFHANSLSLSIQPACLFNKEDRFLS